MPSLEAFLLARGLQTFSPGKLQSLLDNTVGCAQLSNTLSDVDINLINNSALQGVDDVIPT